MKECTERVVKVGLKRKPKSVLDEIEQVSAAMMRNGWELRDVNLEDSLEKAHLFFEREIGPEGIES